MKHKLLAAGLIAAVLWSWTSFADETKVLEFSADELLRIFQHGPWPQPWSKDPSNRVSGNPLARDFGERLFFEPRMSRNGKVACGTCHAPERYWSDNVIHGDRSTPRNTPDLVNVRYRRWFGWDGAADSLWSQSIRPILSIREFASTPQRVAQLVREDAELACHYTRTFGKPPTEVKDDEALLVDIGKALAAYQETIVAARTAFDEFRDALERGDRAAAALYSLPAQRGLKIFIGRGNCSTCHAGPRFTNDEFNSIGIPRGADKSRVDPGRHEGIREVKASKFNLLGIYNDDPTRSTATATQRAELAERNIGEFKAPSLRNAALTRPYMHNGEFGTLRDVVRYYSEIDVDQLRGEGAQLLKPLMLSAQEIDDLIVFVESLTDFRTNWKHAPDGEPSCK